MTLIDLITAQAARLKQAGVSFGHGTTNAFDEAAWLVLHALGLGFDTLEAKAQHTPAPADEAKAIELVTRRIETRLPAAYLTREAWLQNVPFYIDERSIVPRSFIAELLVDAEETGALDAFLSDQTQRVLDLCTGNGSLAVVAALAYPEVRIDAADIDAGALEVARINVERHKLESRIRVLQSDLFDALDAQYDLILCNPPYVTASSMDTLPQEYRHEPALALAGGADGMDLVRRIIDGALERLTPHGVLVLEIGHERGHFEDAFKRLEVVWMETSAGEDQVLLIERAALDRWQQRRQPGGRR